MKRNFPYLTAACALALVACQRNDDKQQDVNLDNTATAEAGTSMNTGTASAIDAAFVSEGIKGDNGEVAIGNLALANGSSQKVKDFGTMLVTDHGAHKTKLAALAAEAGLPVPDSPSPDGQSNIDKLKGLTGAAFDKAFKQAMIEDHQKDIAKYEKQSTSGDAKTAALAKDTLPTLRKHLAAAQAL